MHVNTFSTRTFFCLDVTIFFAYIYMSFQCSNIHDVYGFQTNLDFCIFISYLPRLNSHYLFFLFFYFTFHKFQTSRLSIQFIFVHYKYSFDWAFCIRTYQLVHDFAHTFWLITRNNSAHSLVGLLNMYIHSPCLFCIDTLYMFYYVHDTNFIIYILKRTARCTQQIKMKRNCRKWLGLRMYVRWTFGTVFYDGKMKTKYTHTRVLTKVTNFNLHVSWFDRHTI